MKKVLSGNEAVARGAYEAGVTFAAAYPGTPSTEILENCALYDEIDAQWSSNEKVAVEAAVGAAYGGARTLTAMKHVGLNVAADPFFTVSYTGITAGLVVVSADDPSMHSSQNEQDNRYYAMHAKMPCLEPSDSREAKEAVIKGMELSEKFDTPILLRMTTRLCHSKGVVELADRITPPRREPDIKSGRFLVLPNFARKLHSKVEKRTVELRRFGREFEMNTAEYLDTEYGVITSGVTYQYVKEVAPQLSVLKLTMTWPLPDELVREFVSKVKNVVVVEELDPFLEMQIKLAGMQVEGKRYFPIEGELNPDVVRKGLAEAFPSKVSMIVEKPLRTEVPVRPPVLCPGCPHRGLFYVLSKLKATVTGDIGCYTLGAYEPLKALHTCVCMGGGFTTAEGLEKAGLDPSTVVGVLGDSTFFHSGITGLIDIVYNKGTVTVCVLDNSITAMTGHQQHPGTGATLKGEKTKAVDIKELCRACGVEKVDVVDPFELDRLEKVLKDHMASREPSVVITKRPCVLIEKKKPQEKLVFDEDRCVACGMCFRIGCPALEVETREDGKKIPSVNYAICVHCGLCTKLCRPGALSMKPGKQGGE